MAIVELNILKSKKVLAIFVLAGVGGSFVELTAVWLGNWSYNLPSFAGIPIWLIPAWGNAGIIIISFYKLFSKFDFLEKNE